MTLEEVCEQAQLKEYYNSNNLLTTEDKIKNLRETMKVLALRCDKGETPENILSALEASALHGYWKVS